MGDRSGTNGSMGIDWDVPITTDDGLVLRVDVYRSAQGGAYPVILSSGRLAASPSQHPWVRAAVGLRRELDVVDRFGIEGTGSHGAGLARWQAGRGMVCVEVNRPDRADRRRRGKSDPIDAEQATRAVQAGTATATPRPPTARSSPCACRGSRAVPPSPPRPG